MQVAKPHFYYPLTHEFYAKLNIQYFSNMQLVNRFVLKNKIRELQLSGKHGLQ